MNQAARAHLLLADFKSRSGWKGMLHGSRGVQAQTISRGREQQKGSAWKRGTDMIGAVFWKTKSGNSCTEVSGGLSFAVLGAARAAASAAAELQRSVHAAAYAMRRPSSLAFTMEGAACSEGRVGCGGAV